MTKYDKEPIASVTKDDFDFETMRGTGAGGQKRNKTESAVRCTHKESGAVGFSDATRSQHQNKIDAWKKCIATDKFKKWHKLFIAKAMGQVHNIEENVDREMKNIKVEMKQDGKWINEKDVDNFENTVNVERAKIKET